jgi:hypothetical protein
MPMWVWILVGVGVWFTLSVVIGFAVARVLGAIERQRWSVLPPSRARDDQQEVDDAEPRSNVSRGNNG